jgi:hypothetical protein
MNKEKRWGSGFDGVWRKIGERLPRTGSNAVNSPRKTYIYVRVHVAIEDIRPCTNFVIW